MKAVKVLAIAMLAAFSFTVAANAQVHHKYHHKHNWHRKRHWHHK